MAEERIPFEKVYEEQFSNIYNFVYAQLLHRERAEDLVSDIFIKAMTHYDSYDPSKASVRTWLTNIARNTVIDEFRKTGVRGNSVSLDDDENTVDPSYEDEYDIYQVERENQVKKLLSMLKPDERELLSMIYFQDMKNEEIAAILGINAKAVSARHHRLLAKCQTMAGAKQLKELL
ncbi:MAG: sigma-70 family RNA polymerase sigma factor [Blautia sp.]|nr:sigma-70 family RNA polymerase sigma factor [Blautia sp.]